jgi:hypothetical protein
MLTGLVLVALVVAAGLAIRFGRSAAVVLVIVSIAWFLVNAPVEGPTLVPITPDHGLTCADLGGIAGLLLAGWAWFRPRRLSG